ncbi:MAG: D-alanyl-D-alanine carboxypeptidase [Candidatus Gastranaerophilales bacterium]|nr:D-alanyl-D-alanine carboxypeptidase [Candidatus Gastranaerophilales bacterium]
MQDRPARIIRKITACFLSGIMALSLFGNESFISYAIINTSGSTSEDRIAINQAMEIQSNQVPNWPQGPVVSAESAILMEAETGAILYAKNIHETEYPASITKILTTLIASEQCTLNEEVTMTSSAVFGIPVGSNNIAMNPGDVLTMEQCLNAILIRSANEVSYAVAEHISGSWDDFADLMNERAEELGCVDSHFANPNGLPDENHYTSAYDMAMIGRAFFANEMLCKITTTPMLYIPKPRGDLYDANQMQLLPGKPYYYQYLVGCKTGYTEAARNTLVSCAERDGLKLICVVMRDENPQYYEDTIALLDYGFANFEHVNVSQTETKYNIDNTVSFYSDNDIFGNSQPILSLNQEDFIVLPKTATFADVASSISYDTENENQAAIITYTYHDVYIGSASVDLAVHKTEGNIFDTAIVEEEPEDNLEEASVIFINVIKVLAGIIIIAAGGGLLFLLYILFRRYFAFHQDTSTRRGWRRDRRRRRSHTLSARKNQFLQRRQQRRAAKLRKRERRRRR